MQGEDGQLLDALTVEGARGDAQERLGQGEQEGATQVRFPPQVTVASLLWCGWLLFFCYHIVLVYLTVTGNITSVGISRCVLCIIIVIQ